MTCDLLGLHARISPDDGNLRKLSCSHVILHLLYKLINSCKGALDERLRPLEAAKVGLQGRLTVPGAMELKAAISRWLALQKK